MALASLSRIKSRINSALLLNDGAYAATNTGSVGRFGSDQEITDAVLQTDMQVCQAIIETPNHPARAAFMVGLSANIANGGLLPTAALGAGGVVTVSTDGSAYTPAQRGKSKDEILEVIEVGVFVYGATSDDYAGYYFIEDNRLYHTSVIAKITYCVLAISTVPQAPDMYEEAIIQGALSSLYKDGAASAEMHGTAEQKFQNALNIIRSFPRNEPEQQSFERATATA